MFKDKIVTITGGTGSFGNAVLKRYLNTTVKEIRILSRDEKKQDDMRKCYKNEKIKFYLGDVRDYNSIVPVIRGTDFLFHAAALKQVPSCEFHPMEAVKTNVIGTENVLEAAINHEIKRVIVLSTDKAVYPINAMGISKAMMEKVAIAKSRNSDKTIINVTRYGNVMCSRGSVIPLFVDQISQGYPITLTDPNMTRFMMTLDDAVDLVTYAFQKGNPGELFVQKAPACSIQILADAVKDVLCVPEFETRVIGTRHGEKLHEVLLSREELMSSIDLDSYYCVPPDMRDLNYGKFFEDGEQKITESRDYNSNNTHQLSRIEMAQLLRKLPELFQIDLSDGAN